MRHNQLLPASVVKSQLRLSSLALALCVLCMWISPGIATPYLLCPPTERGEYVETCPAECYGDRQCQRETGLNTSLCCRSPSCGQQCTAGLTAPHHSPVQLCPELDPDTVGLCAEFCSGDSDCSGENQLCCSNGCGHSCSAAAPVCESILRSRNGTFRTGEYVPECSEDGRFALAQCHGSTGYCWCVRPETGEPVGRSMVRFSQPECNNCSYNGQVYYPGDSFMDDCNTCFCYEDGSVSCTEIGCNVPGSSPSAFLSCPVLESDTAGLCSEECASDQDCNSDQKCCSNGCGHTCMDPVPIPFLPPPRQCPGDDDSEEPAVCDVRECTDSCDDPRKLCCQNSCLSLVCVDGVLPPFPCTEAVNSLTGGALLGEFVPQCNEQEGTFKNMQCSSHYCWCVDNHSGEPTSDMREFGQIGELECSRCSDDGRAYSHEEVLDWGEGCSKRKCLKGEIILTEDCEPCIFNGEVYQHGENTDECGYCTCYDGAVACASSTTPCPPLFPRHCVHRGVYHLPGDVFPRGDDCNTCSCSESYEITCTAIADCEGSEESDDMEWWHSVLIASGALIAVLAIIAIALLVVMVMVIRSGRFRHKRLNDNSETLSFEPDTQVLFKNGPPEAESVELKVPVEDEEEPVKT